MTLLTSDALKSRARRPIDRWQSTEKGSHHTMSSVSQIITFRKGRAFTSHKPEAPQVPAPPPAPSATVTLGNDAHKRKLSSATYTQQLQQAIRIEFGSKPTDVRQQEAEKAAEAAEAKKVAKADKADDSAKATEATPETGHASDASARKAAEPTHAQPEEAKPAPTPAPAPAPQHPRIDTTA